MTGDVFALALALPPPGSRRLRRGLYDQIRAAVLDGRLAPGLRLPASRSLAAQLCISRNVIVMIYDLLVTEGYAVSRAGAGTFVAPARTAKKVPRSRRGRLPPGKDWINPAWQKREPIERALPGEGACDLRLGVPDISRFPFQLWKRLSNHALRKMAQASGHYEAPAGRATLREAIALHVSSTRAIACEPDNIVITAGAQQAFDLIARVLISPRRPMVAVENPGYPPCRRAFLAAGARLAPVTVDKEGMRPDRLPRGTAMVCVTPSHQFPTGVAMSASRRQSLLQTAAQMGAVIVEDDYDGEFGFAERPLEALKTLDRDDRVFYVGTFSKSLFPALRLGFIVAPGWARPALTAARQSADWHSPVVDQEALAQFIAGGHFRRHVRRMRRIYIERRQALLAAIHRHCGTLLDPMSGAVGLHLSLALRHPVDVERWSWQRRAAAF